MIRFLFSFLGLVFVFIMGILIMMFGWGLEPVSWGWIIGGGLCSIFLGALFNSL